MRAQLLLAAPTEHARAATPARIDEHLSQPLCLAGYLVAQHQRQLQLRKATIDDVQIAATHSRTAHPHPPLPPRVGADRGAPLPPAVDRTPAAQPRAHRQASARHGGETPWRSASPSSVPCLGGDQMTAYSSSGDEPAGTVCGSAGTYPLGLRRCARRVTTPTRVATIGSGHHQCSHNAVSPCALSRPAQKRPSTTNTTPTTWLMRATPAIYRRKLAPHAVRANRHVPKRIATCPRTTRFRASVQRTTHRQRALNFGTVVRPYPDGVTFVSLR